MSVADVTAMVFIGLCSSPPTGMDVEPPPYSLPARHCPRPALQSCTPTSASTLSTPFQSQHRYSLDTKGGKPWVSFIVQSRSPSSNLLPLFYEHDIITGSVFLDLAKPESIRDVDITVSVSTIALSSIGAYTYKMRNSVGRERPISAAGWGYRCGTAPRFLLGEITDALVPAVREAARLL